MSVVAEQYARVVGVDTHARTHTYVIVDTITGRVIAGATFPTSPPGIRRAIAWMTRTGQGDLLAAIEGTNTYGATLVAALRASEIALTEVHPPKRAERTRGKSDTIDAEAAARAALAQDTGRLIVPRDGKIRSALRVLLMSRRSMDTRRTADRNALTALLRSIDLGVDARKPLTARQVSTIAGWRARPTDDVELHHARAEATRLARDSLQLTAALQRNRDQLQELDASLAPGLLERWGVGPITAAVFLTAWSHPGRIRSEAAFASLAGVAPIPASSGNTIRYRLNRQGDRQLNRALDVVAKSRLATHAETRAYATRRLAEGKSEAEIRRILKRYIARQIHRELTSVFALAPTSSGQAVVGGAVPARERLLSGARSASEERSLQIASGGERSR